MTNISWGGYVESGRLTAFCDTSRRALEPPKSRQPGLTVARCFAPRWRKPPEHHRRGGEAGRAHRDAEHQAMPSTQQQEPTPTSTQLEDSGTAATTPYAHTTSLKSVFYLPDRPMLLPAVTSAAAFVIWQA